MGPVWLLASQTGMLMTWSPGLQDHQSGFGPRLAEAAWENGDGAPTGRRAAWGSRK